MKQIRFCEYDWMTQERWGRVHNVKPHWYYDDDQVTVNDFHDLRLSLEHKPKEVRLPDGKLTPSYIAAGLVSCKERFGKGFFEIDIKLPIGPNLWPAFWMWSWEGWPPEIDVMEAYSNSKSSYFKFRWLRPLSFWNIQTNVHYAANHEGSKHIGAKTHWMGFSNPTNRFVRFAVHWDNDVMEFYYDDRMVRRITDKKILSLFENHKMNVIINNGIRSNVSKKDYINPNSRFSQEINKQQSTLVARNFIYSPYNLNEH